MKYSQIKLNLISGGVSQRQVREECIRRGYQVNLAQVNTALDDELCNLIQSIANEMIETDLKNRSLLENENGNS